MGVKVDAIRLLFPWTSPRFFKSVKHLSSLSAKTWLRTRGAWVRILPGAPVTYETGHLPQFHLLGQAKSIGQLAVTAANLQLPALQENLIDQQTQVGLSRPQGGISDALLQYIAEHFNLRCSGVLCYQNRSVPANWLNGIA